MAITTFLSGGKSKTVRRLVWGCRIAAGLLFLFSGFAKAVDPWGTLYIFEAYLTALGVEVWHNVVLVAVFGLSAFEFCLGLMLAAGMLRRTTPVLGLLMMAVFLPLTLWLAITDKVADCGCFGEAVHLSNWATFFKNLALTAVLALLAARNGKVHWGIAPPLQWIAVVLTAAFIFTVETVGYVSQPLVDFRPYKVGEPLADTDDDQGPGDRFVFIYSKDGETKEFGETDELPDEEEGWTFVDRKPVPAEKTSTKENATTGRTLRLWDMETEEDVTEEALDGEGDKLVVMSPDLRQVSPATTWKLNALYEWAVSHGVDMLAVVSGTHQEIDRWKDLSMANYPIYVADDTQIKEVARGNPAVVYLTDGRIVWKAALKSLETETLTEGESTGAMKEYSPYGPTFLVNLTLIWIISMSVLAGFSFLPELKKMYFKQPKGESPEAQS